MDDESGFTDEEGEWIHPGRAIALAAMAREQAEWAAQAERQRAEAAGAQQTVAQRRTQRRAAQPGPTTRFSLRLDHDVLASLERRADLLGITSSALARNLIRCGLSTGSGERIDGMVTELETLSARLRAAVT